jgi:hypothetical protein
VEIGSAIDKNITLIKIICENESSKESRHLLVASIYIPPTGSAVEDSRNKKILNFSATLSYLNE